MGAGAEIRHQRVAPLPSAALALGFGLHLRAMASRRSPSRGKKPPFPPATGAMGLARGHFLAPIAHPSPEQRRLLDADREAFTVDPAWDGHRLLVTRVDREGAPLRGRLPRLDRHLSHRGQRGCPLAGDRARAGWRGLRVRRSRPSVVREAAPAGRRGPGGPLRGVRGLGSVAPRRARSSGAPAARAPRPPGPAARRADSGAVGVSRGERIARRSARCARGRWVPRSGGALPGGRLPTRTVDPWISLPVTEGGAPIAWSAASRRGRP